MNWRTTAIAFVLLNFAVLTAYSIFTVGYTGIFVAGTANWGAIQIFCDLIIVCGLACIWMIADAQRRQLNPWPFIVVTLFAGSFGPLLYVLRRERITASVAAKPA